MRGRGGARGAQPNNLSDLRLGDLTTFLVVARCSSLSVAARQLNVTPSQVSKALSRLSSRLGRELLSRDGRSAVLTETGRRMVPDIQSAVARLQDLGASTDGRAPLRMAAPSYVAQALVAPILVASPHLSLSCIELPPAMIRALAGERVFDLAILTGAVDKLPTTWTSVAIGEARSGLFASPRLAKSLGAPPVSVERLSTVPFIVPVAEVGGRIVSIDDDCPLTVSERTRGHSAQTIGVALEIAAATDQLVFGPVLAVRRFLATGALVEVRVKGWGIRAPAHVVCDGDRVLTSVQKAIVAASAEALAALTG